MEKAFLEALCARTELPSHPATGFLMKKMGHNLLTAIMRRGNAVAWMLLSLHPTQPVRRDYSDYSILKTSGQKKFYDFFCKKLLPEVGRC